MHVTDHNILLYIKFSHFLEHPRHTVLQRVSFLFCCLFLFSPFPHLVCVLFNLINLQYWYCADKLSIIQMFCVRVVYVKKWMGSFIAKTYLVILVLLFARFPLQHFSTRARATQCDGAFAFLRCVSLRFAYCTWFYPGFRFLVTHHLLCRSFCVVHHCLLIKWYSHFFLRAFLFFSLCFFFLNILLVCAF